MNNNDRQIAPIDYELKQIDLAERQFNLIERRALALSQSTLLPEQFRNNPSNCEIIVEMAIRLKTDPFLIARNIYVVHGKPAFESKFGIALLNRSGRLKGRLQYIYSGAPGADDRACVAFGIDAETGQELRGPEVSIKMAKAEGWYSKNGSKWPNMSELMLMYRAASFFISTYVPEILSGLDTAEALHDMPQQTETEIIGETIRREKSKAPISDFIDGQLVNTETGEIVSEVKQQDALTPQQQSEKNDRRNLSPAFNTINKKLLATEDAEQVNELRRSPLFKKLNQKEQAEFDERAKARFDAFKAGMKPETEQLI